MEKLIYCIADFSVCVETPLPLDISGESAPFLQSEETDCNEKITLVPVDSIQPMQENGIWHQDRYYVTTQEGEVFHIRAAPGENPYAMIEYKSGQPVRISYLRNSKDMIFQSGYLLNMLGLEQLMLRHDTQHILVKLPCRDVIDYYRAKLRHGAAHNLGTEGIY